MYGRIGKKAIHRMGRESVVPEECLRDLLVDVKKGYFARAENKIARIAGRVSNYFLKVLCFILVMRGKYCSLRYINPLIREVSEGHVPGDFPPALASPHPRPQAREMSLGTRLNEGRKSRNPNDCTKRGIVLYMDRPTKRLRDKL